MEIKIKSEPLSGCIACLKNDVQVFSEYELSNHTILAYKDLVKDQITKLKSSIEICGNCIEKLNEIIEFKNTCVKSIEVLNTKSYDIFDDINEDTDVNTILSTSIKEEDTIFVQELQIKPEKFVKREKIPKKKKVTKKEQSQKDTKKATNLPAIKGLCKICYYNYPNSHRHAIEVHSRECEDHLLKCAICEEGCYDVDELLKHFDLKHHEYEYPKYCGKCEFSTKIRETFVKHVETCYFNNTKRAYPCDFCEKVFYRAVYLKYHNQIHFGALRCSYCIKTFFDKDEHEIHMNEHRERRRYICDFCGTTVSTKSSMLLHMMKFHNDSIGPTFQCDGCEKTYKNMQSLKIHVQIHHLNQKVQCSYCGNSYTKTSHLTRHINTKHLKIPRKPEKKNPKPKPKTRDFPCNQCDMSFFRKAALQKHTYSHTKTRPYVCTLCPTGYYMNMYLRNHYQKEHGIIYTAKEVRRLCGRKYIGEEFD